MYYSSISPFGGWRHHLSPRKRGHYKAPLCCELLMKGLLFRALFCPLNRGKSGAARIGGGERSEPITRMRIIPYDTESQSRNADFIRIAAERQSATLSGKAAVAPFFKNCGEAATTTLGPKARQT